MGLGLGLHLGENADADDEGHVAAKPLGHVSHQSFRVRARARVRVKVRVRVGVRVRVRVRHPPLYDARRVNSRVARKNCRIRTRWSVRSWWSTMKWLSSSIVFRNCVL